MDCEICGQPTRELFLISVEGTKLQVCRICSTYGTFISQVKETPLERTIVISEEEPETDIVDGYAELIRTSRERLGLNQEEFAKKINENLNVIKKIEKGRMIPTEKLAAKLERLFKIRLFQQVKRQSIEKKKIDTSLSVEDVAVVKK